MFVYEDGNFTFSENTVDANIQEVKGVKKSEAKKEIKIFFIPFFANDKSQPLDFNKKKEVKIKELEEKTE